MLHNHMSDLMLEPPPSAKEDNKAQRTASRRKGLAQDPDFRKAIDTLDAQKATGYAVHPKMDCLKRLIIDHFGQTLAEDGTTQQETRAMIFVSFREAVGEIVAFLNTEQPLLKATAFIGQGTDKKGNKGLTQKEQLNVIQQFKAGEFNILVATSIGEEGLDIGEVDLIVCYDSQKTPIRMVRLLLSAETSTNRALSSNALDALVVNETVSSTFCCPTIANVITGPNPTMRINLCRNPSFVGKTWSCTMTFLDSFLTMSNPSV